MITELASLVRDGTLRAAINTGNRALVQQVGDEVHGVSPALARRLAEKLGATLEPIIYSGAGKVFADAGGEVWDLGFLAIDPTRAEKVSFTRPYHVIEATYAMRRDAPLKTPDEADRKGVTILSSNGSAYDLFLKANLRHAKLENVPTPGDSFEAFRAGRGDVVAGVRASLERAFAEDRDIVVMGPALTRVEQAMVLPHPNDPRIAALDAFVARAIEDGFVARALSGSGQ